MALNRRRSRPLRAANDEADEPCRLIQGYLYDYLKTDIDPHDFVYFIPEYLEARGIEVDGYPEDITPDQLDSEADFKAWLLEDDRAKKDWSHDGANHAPAYLYLHAEKTLPSGTWLIHFTNAPKFEGFRYGAVLDGLHLSRWTPVKVKVKDCETNLDLDQLSLHEVIFGFAFEATTRNVLQYARKYGKHAVLFQCDCAVRAYHDGDDEAQAIFPLCSDYNQLMLFDVVAQGLIVETTTGEEVEFQTVEQVIKYIETREPLGGLNGGWPRLRRSRPKR